MHVPCAPQQQRRACRSQMCVFLQCMCFFNVYLSQMTVSLKYECFSDVQVCTSPVRRSNKDVHTLSDFKRYARLCDESLTHRKTDGFTVK